MRASAAWRPGRLSTGRLLGAFLLVKGILLVVLMPPWQGPDEPTRLEPAIILAKAAGLPASMSPDREYQARTVESMRLFQAWRFYEREAPPQNAATFEEANLPGGSSILYETAAIYLPASWMLRCFDGESVLGALYAARLSSLLLHLVTVILVAWLSGFVFPAPEHQLLRQASVVIYGVHPQLSFLAASAHADNVAFLLGAAVLVLLVVAADRSRQLAGSAFVWAGPFVLAMVLAGISGYLIRKLLILAPFLISCIPILFWPRLRRAGVLEGISRLVLIGVAAVFLFCVVLHSRPEWVGWRLLSFPQLVGWEELRATTFASWVRFAGILFLTFWMALGSLVHKLSLGWVAAIGVMLAATVLGWIGIMKSNLSYSRRLSGLNGPALGILFVWLAWVGVSIFVAYGPHMASFKGSYIYNVEGRYLLSAFPSISVLWLAGLSAISIKAWRNGPVQIWVGLLMLLHAVVIFKFIIPIYYLSPI